MKQRIMGSEICQNKASVINTVAHKTVICKPSERFDFEKAIKVGVGVTVVLQRNY